MQVTDLLAVRQAISLAKGVPNAHYIDPALYEEEKKPFCSINGRSLEWLQMCQHRAMRFLDFF